jgi:hypothetical protein
MGGAIGNGQSAIGEKARAAGFGRLLPTAHCLLPQLRGQPLAALGAAARKHLLAALGGHAGAETVAALPDKPARLIGALGAHGSVSMLLGPKMKARGLPWPAASVKAGHRALARPHLLFVHALLTVRRNRTQQMFVFRPAERGNRVSKENEPGMEGPKGRDETTGPLGRIVELARDVLRERGLTDDQIDALLKRHRAPDNLR